MGRRILAGAPRGELGLEHGGEEGFGSSLGEVGRSRIVKRIDVERRRMMKEGDGSNWLQRKLPSGAV